MDRAGAALAQTHNADCKFQIANCKCRIPENLEFGICNLHLNFTKKNMKIAITTLGCKINQYDSAVIQNRLEAKHSFVPFEERRGLLCDQYLHGHRPRRLGGAPAGAPRQADESRRQGAGYRLLRPGQSGRGGAAGRRRLSSSVSIAWTICSVSSRLRRDRGKLRWR